MNELSEWVTDSELTTEPNPDFTVHVSNIQDPLRGRIQHREYWQRGEIVGVGSFGRVYREKCVQGQRDAGFRAVKDIIKVDGSRSSIKTLQRELEAIARFSQEKFRHCFVRSYGWYQTENAICIAMEFLELGDLRKYLLSHDPLEEKDAREITFQMLEALKFMHFNKFAHRDLKPGVSETFVKLSRKRSLWPMCSQNVLIKVHPPHGEWWIKIGDFGITKRIQEEEQGPISSTMKGTLRYMAPELRRFTPRHTDYATDIWSLGEVSYEMLTKETSFSDPELLGYIENPDSFPVQKLSNHNVSQQATQFIKGCMQPYPRKRLSVEQGLNTKWMVEASKHRDSILPPQPVKVIDTVEEESSTISNAPWTTVSSGPLVNVH
jgi:serine/threonine protein kinase